MTTNTASQAAPTPKTSLPGLRSAAVLSALGLVPAELTFVGMLLSNA